MAVSTEDIRNRLAGIQRKDRSYLNGVMDYKQFLPDTIGFEQPDNTLPFNALNLIHEQGQKATAIDRTEAANQKAQDAWQEQLQRMKQLRRGVGQAMRQEQPILQPNGNVQFPGGPIKDWRHNVVQFAKNFLGTPYVYGGESPQGFDCSGLVQYVYSHMGLSLPRVAADQGRMGHAIPVNSLKPGDLVLYDNSSRRNGADHVAIYIGNGRIIEAPRPGENVRIAPMTYEGMGNIWGIRIRINGRRFQ